MDPFAAEKAEAVNKVLAKPAPGEEVYVCPCGVGVFTSTRAELARNVARLDGLGCRCTSCGREPHTFRAARG